MRQIFQFSFLFKKLFLGNSVHCCCGGGGHIGGGGDSLTSAVGGLASAGAMGTLNAPVKGVKKLYQRHKSKKEDSSGGGSVTGE